MLLYNYLNSFTKIYQSIRGGIIMNLISGEFAAKIYDILVKHCGAPNNEREKDAFVYSATGRGITEYRICYALGFGGKFWNNDGWYVNCYKEDSDERKKKLIEAANTELSSLRAEFLKAG